MQATAAASWKAIALCGLILLPAIQSEALNYFYDPSRASGASWHDANAWSTNGFDGLFDQTWADGNTAYFKFSAPKLVNLSGQDVVVAGLVNSNTIDTVGISSASLAELHLLDPGVLQGGKFTIGWTGSGPIKMTGTGYSTSTTLELREMVTVEGTVWVNAGACVPYPGLVTSNAVFRVNGGSINCMSYSAYEFPGPVIVDSGHVVIGRFSGDPVSVLMSHLSGAGGRIVSRQVGTAGDGIINHLTINQSSNTTYSGTVAGVSDAFQGFTYLTLTKSGAGELALAGTVNLRQGTTVDGGRLAINGTASKQFHNQAGGAGSDAIRVASGGQLGGTATLSILGGTDVTIEAGGGLFAGTAGAAGRTTYAFEAGQGGVLDLSGMAAGTGGLRFDLGGNATAGTTYDQIKLTGGTLALGSGVLGIDDLAVNPLAGLAVGTYVLFDSAAISGTLGSEVTGRISPEFYGTLRVAGSTLVLDVSYPPGVLLKVR